MAYRVGRAFFSDWRSIPLNGGRCIDTFILDVSSSSGLSPFESACAVKSLLPELSKLRKSSSIWVRVDSPGFWYPMELQRILCQARLPVAVTRTTAKTISLADFSSMPVILQSELPSSVAEISFPDLDRNSLSCLRVMARLTCAFTPEICSLTGLGEKTTIKCLRQLVQRNYLSWVNPRQRAKEEREMGFSRNFTYWQITKRGIGIALRSWGIPPGFRFTARRELQWSVGFRHRRVSRLWPGWLRRSIHYGKIWTGWSEVFIPGLGICPDSLAWGKLGDKETLFWLEVDSGHQSAEKTRTQMRSKFFLASQYVQSRKINLVFAVLGRPWVVKAVQTAFSGLGEQTAVVLADWRSFGRLPIIQWGRVKLAVDGK